MPVLSVAALVVASLAVGDLIVRLSPPRLFEDGQVYLEGGRALMQGRDLYAAHLATPTPHFTLLFTYPPFAALVFAALAGLTIHHGLVVLIGASVAGLFVACWTSLIAARPSSAERVRQAGVTLAGAAACAVVSAVLEPVQQTFAFAQINLVLLALILVDCLHPGSRWARGVLVGTAAAIKLTPLAFLIYFAARRDWGALVRALVTFLVCALIAFVVAPQDSVEYWTQDLRATNRIGTFWYAGNESIRAVLPRLGITPGLSGIIWVALAAGCAVLCWFAVRARSRRGDELGAVVVTGLFTVLASPVSWTHHWVWIVPTLIWSTSRALRNRSASAAVYTVLAASIFIAAPQWRMPSGHDAELHWTVAENVAGNAYVWIALVTLVGTCTTLDSAARGRRRSLSPDAEAPAEHHQARTAAGSRGIAREAGP